jgi:hypothetical protein
MEIFSPSITGSTGISGSLTVTGGITGSLFGTSSFATTASYALNAPTVDTGGLLTTASFNSYTGSSLSQFAGTASFATTASFAINSRGLLGGADQYIPLWSGSNALTSSYLNQSGSILKTIYNGSDVGLKLDFANNTYTLGDNINPGSAGYIQSTPAGILLRSELGDYPSSLRVEHNTFSTDVVNNNDDIRSNINQNATSIKSDVTDATLGVFTTINQISTNVQITGSTSISGSLSVTGGITGSLIGTSSWATNALTASYVTGSVFNNTNPALSSSYALTASFALNAGGGGGTPGGSNTQIQFNNNGAFSGSSALTFNSASNALTLTGSLLLSQSYISKVDYIDFDTIASNTAAIARLKWNDTDGTLDLGLKGGNVTLQVGQESLVRVVNKTATNITLLEANYQAVRLTGAQGQRLKVDLAQATNDGLSAETLGLVTETIANNQEGFVTTNGLVRGIDTRGTLQGESWADGDILYLSPTTAGNVTNIKPVAPNHLVIIGYVVHAHQTQGSIFVKVDNGYEIDELHNVLINTGSLTSGQLLVRSGSVWINSTQLTGSYGLTGSLTVTGGITGSLFGTATNGFPFNGNAVITGSLQVSGSRLIITGSFSQNASTASFGGVVGIGTSTPAYRLDVSGSARLGGIITTASIDTSLVTSFRNNLDISVSASSGDRGIRVYATNNLTTIPNGAAIQFFSSDHTNFPGQFYLDSGANNSAALILRTAQSGGTITERVRVTAAGNVGIGKTAPTATLDVLGNVRISGSLTVSASTAQFLAQGGTLTNPAYSFSNDTNTGFRGVGSGGTQYVASGVGNINFYGDSIRVNTTNITIRDTAANHLLGFRSVNLASNGKNNYIRLANADTGSATNPRIELVSSATDTNISLDIVPLGTGSINLIGITRITGSLTITGSLIVTGSISMSLQTGTPVTPTPNGYYRATINGAAVFIPFYV